MLSKTENALDVLLHFRGTLKQSVPRIVRPHLGQSVCLPSSPRMAYNTALVGRKHATHAVVTRFQKSLPRKPIWGQGECFDMVPIDKNAENPLILDLG